MGKAVETILKILQTGAEATATLMDALLVGHAAMRPRPGRMKYEPISFKHDWAELYKRRQSFYSLLNQLKRDGLVKKKSSAKGAIWHITPHGISHFTKVQLRKSRNTKEGQTELSLPKKKYKVAKAKGLMIVAFDIPESERKRRDWLRSYLVSFGFSQLQKSVWTGQNGIPEEFVKDLRELNMLSWVHIFSVAERGTLTELPPK